MLQCTCRQPLVAYSTYMMAEPALHNVSGSCLPWLSMCYLKTGARNTPLSCRRLIRSCVLTIGDSEESESEEDSLLTTRCCNHLDTQATR